MMTSADTLYRQGHLIKDWGLKRKKKPCHPEAIDFIESSVNDKLQCELMTYWDLLELTFRQWHAFNRFWQTTMRSVYRISKGYILACLYWSPNTQIHYICLTFVNRWKVYFFAVKIKIHRVECNLEHDCHVVLWSDLTIVRKNTIIC